MHEPFTFQPEYFAAEFADGELSQDFGESQDIEASEFPELHAEFDLRSFDHEAGSEGESRRAGRGYVRWIQQSLNKILGMNLVVDGIPGGKTRSAVRRFQIKKGLTVDGKVGPKTEAALVAAGASAPPSGGGRIGAQSSAALVEERVGPWVCPEPGRLAQDRCLRPGTSPCPPLPDLLCQRDVDGIPFEYPTKVRRASGRGAYAVVNRIRRRKQRFIPSVREALRAFIKNMKRFGMPIEAILTAGSLYCRCIRGTDKLSNHSFGDAIDIVGVRWAGENAAGSGSRETLVHNYADPAERALLVRVNACLRLSFATVIDYHRSDHRDHFHCDMNRGRGRMPRWRSNIRFVQEALTLVLGRKIRVTGKFDSQTQQALSEFSGTGAEALANSASLNRILEQLFSQVARGPHSVRPNQEILEDDELVDFV